ncbi:type II toxin-antitoxin system Phd/YefM family antitoxin [Rathayibacter soli]|uniref:type II toxin-antitoxin system Phd/YefM family antitoxin n=1 Tax=Rathayibacter soli TaxID=3144168 RepID=UPI0027E4162E|nr:type II toxin-antitoxin system Phd/YefM family antitoxin [Glaciibacter superstes]
MGATWQVQEAKQRFSELVRAAESGEPQIISRHGRPVAALVDIDDFRATHDSGPSFHDFLLAGPSFDALEFPDRQIDPERLAEFDG